MFFYFQPLRISIFHPVSRKTAKYTKKQIVNQEYWHNVTDKKSQNYNCNISL